MSFIMSSIANFLNAFSLEFFRIIIKMLRFKIKAQVAHYYLTLFNSVTVNSAEFYCFRNPACFEVPTSWRLTRVL